MAAASLLNVQLTIQKISSVGNVCWQFTFSRSVAEQSLNVFLHYHSWEFISSLHVSATPKLPADPQEFVPRVNLPEAGSDCIIQTLQKYFIFFFFFFWSLLCSLGRSCYLSADCNVRCHTYTVNDPYSHIQLWSHAWLGEWGILRSWKNSLRPLGALFSKLPASCFAVVPQ